MDVRHLGYKKKIPTKKPLMHTFHHWIHFPLQLGLESGSLENGWSTHKRIRSNITFLSHASVVSAARFPVQIPASSAQTHLAVLVSWFRGFDRPLVTSYPCAVKACYRVYVALSKSVKEKACEFLSRLV